jgi:protein-S-isoprenylcysteine O-methyltransferase Ste14
MNRVNRLLRNRIAVSRIAVFGVLSILLVSLNVWHTEAPFVKHLLSLIGWALVAICVAGRIWCGSYICGYKNDSLVTDGPYSVSRNPLYFFSFLGGFGVMLITETLLLPALFALLFWMYYPGVIRREEEVLRGRHGAAFSTYCTRVPRFWPRFDLYSEPASYVVSAAHFRRHLADVLWFVLAGGIVEFIEGMHTAGYLPTLVRIF